MKVLFLLLCLSSLMAEEKKYVIQGCREGAGMCSMFFDVMTLVYCYDLGIYEGVEVDFQKQGLYYDQNHGENWWNYYFEPIKLGTKTNPVHNIGMVPLDPGQTLPELTNDDRCYLINKYFHLKKPIRDRIEEFKNSNFNDYFVIGIHYRGTDKYTEAPRVPYKEVLSTLNIVKKIYGKRRYKIFIATDEVHFLDYFTSNVRNTPLCYLPNATRSSNYAPIHFHSSTPYKVGEEALIDCYLLSKCDALIRCQSSLSLWSTFINPSLPTYLLN